MDVCVCEFLFSRSSHQSIKRASEKIIDADEDEEFRPTDITNFVGALCARVFYAPRVTLLVSLLCASFLNLCRSGAECRCIFVRCGVLCCTY
jgi:hypothetical protein